MKHFEELKERFEISIKAMHTKWVASKLEEPPEREMAECKALALPLMYALEDIDDFHRAAWVWMHYICRAYYWNMRNAFDLCNRKKSILRIIMGYRYFPGYEFAIDDYTRHLIYSMRDKFHPETYKIIQEDWYYKSTPSKYMEDGSMYYIHPLMSEECLNQLKNKKYKK